MFHWPGNRTKICFDLYISLPRHSVNLPLFYSASPVAPNPVAERDYVSALLLELREAALSPAWACRTVRSIYFGASLPSLLSGQSLRRLLFGVCNFFPVDPNLEITVEVLPGTISPAECETLLRVGVNRIRVRAHSFDNSVLKILGCPWSDDNVAQTIAAAREAGFANVGIDMLFGTPEQSVDAFRSDLLKVIDADLDLITYSPIIIKPDTSLGLLLGRELKSLHRHSHDLDLERMYRTLVGALECSAYGRTTLFQFAKAGSEPRYNLYQTDKFDLLGIGCGAFSRFTTLRRESLQRVNIPDAGDYVLASVLKHSRIASAQSLTPSDVVREYVACRLQQATGLNLENFKRIFGLNLNQVQPGLVDILIENGLIQKNGNYISLTPKGAICAQNVVRSIFQLDWEYPDQRKFKRNALGYFSWRKIRNSVNHGRELRFDA